MSDFQKWCFTIIAGVGLSIISFYVVTDRSGFADGIKENKDAITVNKKESDLNSGKNKEAISEVCGDIKVIKNSQKHIMSRLDEVLKELKESKR
jgi:hypothetical protein